MPLNRVKVSTLISIGAHPDTGRARRSNTDARAVELALGLNPSQLDVVHAGDPSDPALAYYSGMGLEQIRVLAQAAEDDALSTVTAYFQHAMPDIILTGMRAEDGESSGMLPFFLAQQLHCPMVMGIAEILSIEEGKAKVLQALPRGQRRAIQVALPFVASVDLAASVPRQSAFGRARHCDVVIHEVAEHMVDEERQSWEQNPAKPRAKRLKVVKAKSAADRFKAATAKAESTGGRVIKDEPIDDMAQAVLDLLIEEHVVHQS